MATQPPTPLELEAQRLNDELAQFKESWLRRQQEEYRIRTEVMVNQRDQAVLAAFKAGSNKAALCRALRTTARATVYDILDRAQRAETFGPRLSEVDLATPAPAPQEPAPFRANGGPIVVAYDSSIGILTLDLHNATLDGMAAAQGAPVTGIWEFTRTGTTGGWSSAAQGRKGPFDYQIAAWLNAAPEDVNGDPNPLYDNVLRQALTDAGIDDIIKSEAQNTPQPQDAGTFELTI